MYVEVFLKENERFYRKTKLLHTTLQLTGKAKKRMRNQFS